MESSSPSIGLSTQSRSCSKADRISGALLSNAQSAGVAQQPISNTVCPPSVTRRCVSVSTIFQLPTPHPASRAAEVPQFAGGVVVRVGHRRLHAFQPHPSRFHARTLAWTLVAIAPACVAAAHSPAQVEAFRLLAERNQLGRDALDDFGFGHGDTILRSQYGANANGTSIHSSPSISLRNRSQPASWKRSPLRERT